MEHAFMIMFHDNIPQVKRLIEYLDAANTSFVLGMDRKFENEHIKKKLMETVKKGRVKWLSPKINWGGCSQIFAMLDMLKAAVSMTPLPDYIHFLTGVDVPMMTMEYFNDFFEKNNGVY